MTFQKQLPLTPFSREKAALFVPTNLAYNLTFPPFPLPSEAQVAGFSPLQPQEYRVSKQEITALPPGRKSTGFCRFHQSQIRRRAGFTPPLQDSVHG